MKVNQMVQIHNGYNSAGGIFIHEEIITGRITKINKKSIRVHMTHAKYLINGKVTREYNINEEAKFTFWKTVNRQFGENAGKREDLIKAAKELNEVLGLDPQIKTGKEVTNKELTEQILEAADLIIPEDVISDETMKVIKMLKGKIVDIYKNRKYGIIEIVRN